MLGFLWKGKAEEGTLEVDLKVDLGRKVDDKEIFEKAVQDQVKRVKRQKLEEWIAEYTIGQDEFEQTRLAKEAYLLHQLEFIDMSDNRAIEVLKQSYPKALIFRSRESYGSGALEFRDTCTLTNFIEAIVENEYK